VRKHAQAAIETFRLGSFVSDIPTNHETGNGEQDQQRNRKAESELASHPHILTDSARESKCRPPTRISFHILTAPPCDSGHQCGRIVRITVTAHAANKVA
jgi:hypothetical protein